MALPQPLAASLSVSKMASLDLPGAGWLSLWSSTTHFSDKNSFQGHSTASHLVSFHFLQQKSLYEQTSRCEI